MKLNNVREKDERLPDFRKTRVRKILNCHQMNELKKIPIKQLNP